VEASALSAPAGLSRDAAPLAHASPWLRLRSDEQLVNLFRSGSEDAFRAIHDRYRQRLFSYSRQMLGGSGSDAEDVMQDVFLRAYRALRADERPVSLRSWLYRVAHNRCIDTLRRPTPEASDVFEMSRPPAHDPCDAAERREDLRRLVADVRRLPDHQRSALLMREMDGMSYADLAHALDTSVPAIKSLLVRARIGLVEAIEARDADCADIRYDLAASYDRGVRSSGRARKHLRDCNGCTTYRAQLRGLRQGFAALSPALAAPGLAKLLSLGGVTSGAGVAAGGAATGTTAAIGGGTAAAVSVSKVAAIVCSAAAITGGAVEVKKIVAPAPRAASQPVHQNSTAVGTPAADALRGPAGADVPPAIGRTIVPAEDLALHPSIPMGPSLAPLRENANGSGGTLAPSEEPAAGGTAAPAEPAVTDDGEIMLPIGEDVALPLDGEGSTTTDGEHPPPGTSSSTEDSTTTGSSTTGSQTSDGSEASASTSGDTGTASGSTTAPSSSAGDP